MSPPHPVHRVKARVGHTPSRRLAAAGALVTDAAALMLTVVLTITQPLFALVLLVVGLAFVACSVTALTTGGIRRRVLAAASAGLLVGELVLVVSWGAGAGPGAWAGPVVLGLLAGGFTLGRYALRVRPTGPEPGDDPPVRAAPAPAASPARTTARAVLFVNPQSGGGKAEDFDLVGLARELGVEAVVLRDGDDLEAKAQAAVAAGAEVLGMAGGDGSQACVLGVAAHHDLPFVCIPSGTRNHFALDLGLDRRDPRRAFTAFTDGELRHIDYATVNGRVFVNNVALGVYAAIVDQDGYREAKVQTTLDLLPQLVEAGGPWFDLEVEVPGEGDLRSCALLLISNNPYELSGGVIQRQRLDEGRLGVIALNPGNIRELVAATLLTAAGRPDAARALSRWETESLTVGSPHAEVVAGVDGETVRLESPLRFEVVHRGARILVPPGSAIGLDEQRAGPGARFAGLLEVALDLPARSE